VERKLENTAGVGVSLQNVFFLPDEIRADLRCTNNQD
jgi:hypothetical protein